MKNSFNNKYNNVEKTAYVVGAGLSGATVARVLAENGYAVTVLEKRNHVAGNAYDYVNEYGITVQQYGPHIFHTSNEQTFEFLSRFTKWFPYKHKVLGNLNGRLVPVPFNLDSLRKTFDKEQADEIEAMLINEIGMDKKVPVLALKNHPNATVREFADFVYDNVFYKYTLKQWGFKPEELGEAVTARVPVSVSYKDGYFSDEFQCQPFSFTETVQNMLSHENITVQTEVDALGVISVKDDDIFVNGKKFDGPIIWTGRLDELFNYEYGALDFRSLKFEFETLKTDSYQAAAVVNYNTSMDYTRISEFKKFTSPSEIKGVTTIVKEYPSPCGKYDVPYYPIPTPDAEAKYQKYADRAKNVKNLYLAGRLAKYKYVNMDVAVTLAKELCDAIL